MIDLNATVQLSMDHRSIILNQAGYGEREFTEDQLRAELEMETDFERALALQEALDVLTNSLPPAKEQDTVALCICMERVGDNGPCPVHGDPA